MIGVAARLCGVHPQTLRTYERMGLVCPAREKEKNRLYSQTDVERVKQIQRLTQDLGVNLAGVEVILRLLDQIEEIRADTEEQVARYVAEVEKRLAAIAQNSNAPVRRDFELLPVPRIQIKKSIDL